MDFALFDTPRPEVDRDTAAQIVHELYGLDGVAEPFEGERDRSFKITTASEASGLKVGNAADRPDALDCQAGAMEHALLGDPSLPIPSVIRTADGALSSRFQGHSVQFVTFMEGASPPSAEVPPGLRRSIGSVAGRLSRALRGYDHPALHRELPWDLAQLGALAPLIRDVDPKLRPLIEAVFSRLEDGFGTRIGRLTKQALHGDINLDNVIVDPNDPERIVGSFDFGDMTWGPGFGGPSRRSASRQRRVSRWRFPKHGRDVETAS